MNLPRALLFALLVSVGAVACTSTSSSVCTPACRTGYTCVGGSCVTGCNPPCGAGQVCSGYGAGAYCTAADVTVGDATYPLDTVGPNDGTPPGDTQGDGNVTSDAALDGNADVAEAALGDVQTPDGSGLDVSASDATGTDAAAVDVVDVVIDAGPPCGHPGEMCCYTTFCQPGNLCSAGVCQAIVRATGECTRSSDCASGQVCTGPTTCGDHGCFVCATPPGTTPFGGACTSASECATGVCRGRRCTVPCDLGPTANADCAAHSAGYICTQLLFSSGTAPNTTVVALGACRQSCARNADCTLPEVCLPQLNYATNTMDFICGTSSITAPAGTACTSGSECQSFLCVPGAGADGGTGACTAPCLTSVDCPATATRCVDITWSRPAGGGQPGHGCLP